MNPVIQARSLSDIYISRGEVFLKPEDFLSRLIVTIWQRVSSFFCSSNGEELEEKVVETLFLEQQKGVDRALIAGKVSDFALQHHFALRERAALPFVDPFEQALAKAELSWLRKKTVPAGGVTESAHFILDPFDKKEIIGVFKTEINRSIWAQFSQFMKSFFGQRYYLSQEEEAEAMAEEVSYGLSEAIQADLVVKSRCTRFSGDFGNFQEYVRDISSESVKSAWYSKETYEKGERLLFQKYVIFNFLTGNLDSHRGNSLLRIDEGGVLRRIWSIDNANTYPRRAHSSWSILPPPKNQYAWGLEKIAQDPFEEELVRWVREIATPQAENFIQRGHPLLHEEATQLFRDRLAVLSKHVREGAFSPEDLLKYRYESHVQDFLSPTPSFGEFLCTKFFQFSTLTFTSS